MSDETGATPAAGGVLSDVERAVLDFAKLRWRYQGAMEGRVREEFGWSRTRYHQVLNALLDRPEAAEYAPTLVARLIRLRDARREQRSADRPSGGRRA